MMASIERLRQHGLAIQAALANHDVDAFESLVRERALILKTVIDGVGPNGGSHELREAVSPLLEQEAAILESAVALSEELVASIERSVRMRGATRRYTNPPPAAGLLRQGLEA
ncbi:MAG: hypothetical protein ACOCTG_05640 [Bacteroidota bacterium]